MSKCVYMQMSTGTHKDKKGTSDSIAPTICVLVSRLTWVLGRELEPSERAPSTLNY